MHGKKQKLKKKLDKGVISLSPRLFNLYIEICTKKVKGRRDWRNKN